MFFFLKALLKHVKWPVEFNVDFYTNVINIISESISVFLLFTSSLHVATVCSYITKLKGVV